MSWSLIAFYFGCGYFLIAGDEEGDNFYIVAEGKFNIFVTRLNGSVDKVLESGPGMFFGEVALMYNAPRSASCIVSEAVLWF